MKTLTIRLRQTVTYVINCYRAAFRAENVHITLMTILAGISFDLARHSPTDQPQNVSIFLTLIAIFGFFSTIPSLMELRLCIGDLRNNIIRLLWQYMLLIFALSFLAYTSATTTALLAWINANPAAVLTLLIAVWISKMIRSVGYRVERIPSSAIALAGAVSEMALATRRDARVSATHEAGHALLYSRVSGLPVDFQAVIFSRSHNGILGSVSGIKSEHLVHSRSFVEWRMFTNLAGQVAEETLLGEATLGAFSDMKRWQTHALDYLANGFGPVYFNPPTNALEVAQNQTTLTELQNRQRDVLRVFFAANKSVLAELSEAIQKRKVIKRDELVPFFESIRLTEGMIFPSTEANI